jgi:hypothetical protein
LVPEQAKVAIWVAVALMPCPIAPRSCARCVPHMERGHVGVALGCGHPGMAKHLLDYADMHTLLYQQRRGRVPSVVDPDFADSSLSQDGLPGPPVLSAIDRAAVLCGEHQVTVHPSVSRPQPLDGLFLAMLPEKIQ